LTPVFSSVVEKRLTPPKTKRDVLHTASMGSTLAESGYEVALSLCTELTSKRCAGRGCCCCWCSLTSTCHIAFCCRGESLPSLKCLLIRSAVVYTRRLASHCCIACLQFI